MIKVDNIETWGFEHAIRGMRNPMNSWEKSDSTYGCEHPYDESLCAGCENPCNTFYVGDNDLILMRKLFKAGTEHRKYARQIFVSMDITAPLYWWKEFDTYKVGTVANSCSTMHKITNKIFDCSDFSLDKLVFTDDFKLTLDTIDRLNELRDMYMSFVASNAFSKRDIWYSIIQLLPSSYNQKRTVTMTYENVFAMIHQRKGHKLDEWNEFVKVLQELPYVIEIMEENK